LNLSPKAIAWLAFWAVSIFWGTTFLAIKIGVDTFPPFAMAAFRHTLAGTVLISYFLLRGYKIPPLKSLKTFSTNGLLMLAGGNGIISWAMQYVGSGLTALICALTPVWIVLINRLTGDKTRISWLVILGFALCLIGQVFFFKDKIAYFDDPLYAWGIAAVVLSNIFWAIGTVYSKNHQTGVPPLFAAGLQMIPGGLFLFIVAAIRGELSNLHPAMEAINSLVYLILFGSLLAYSAYMYVIKNLPATIVSTYAYINTLVAILLGWAWLGEPLDATTFVASIITIGGVVLVSKNA
jgi:drug/metabolite transporter (DMT)-like permease